MFFNASPSGSLEKNMFFNASPSGSLEKNMFRMQPYRRCSILPPCPGSRDPGGSLEKTCPHALLHRAALPAHRPNAHPRLHPRTLGLSTSSNRTSSLSLPSTSPYLTFQKILFGGAKTLVFCPPTGDYRSCRSRKRMRARCWVACANFFECL